MDTRDLIQRLSAEARGPELRAGEAMPSLRARLRWAAAGTSILAVTLVIAVWGLRPGLLASLTTGAGLVKFGLVLAIASAAYVLVLRSAEPGRPLLAGREVALSAVVAAFIMAHLITRLEPLGVLSPSALPAECIISIVALALPPLAAVLSTLRLGASTRPALTGWLAGLLAGALGAFGFALYCPMDRIIDIAAWYLLAISLVGMAGAGIGSWLLRW